MFGEILYAVLCLTPWEDLKELYTLETTKSEVQYCIFLVEPLPILFQENWEKKHCFEKCVMCKSKKLSWYLTWLLRGGKAVSLWAIYGQLGQPHSRMWHGARDWSSSVSLLFHNQPHAPATPHIQVEYVRTSSSHATTYTRGMMYTLRKN